MVSSSGALPPRLPGCPGALVRRPGEPLGKGYGEVRRRRAISGTSVPSNSQAASAEKPEVQPHPEPPAAATFTVKEQLALLPEASVAETSTRLFPTGKVLPDAVL